MIKGPAIAYRAVVPRMWPQQVPAFQYVEIPLAEETSPNTPIVTLEQWEAARDARRPCNGMETE